MAGPLNAMWSRPPYCARTCGVRDLQSEGKLAGAGIVIINPPHTLEADLLALMPWLCEVLKQGDGAGWRLDGIVTEEMAASWAG